MTTTESKEQKLKRFYDSIGEEVLRYKPASFTIPIKSEKVPDYIERRVLSYRMRSSND